MPSLDAPKQASIVPNDLVVAQRRFFETGCTRDPKFRIAQLKRFRDVLKKQQESVLDALHTDLGKPPFEAFASELGLVFEELQFAIRNVPRWAKATPVPTPLMQWPGRSWIQAEPYGVTLVMGPWNYPFQLVVAPMIASLAAGNTSIIKPSEHAPATAAVLARMIAEAFDASYVTAVAGGIAESQALLREKFDYIFFTGGSHVGRIVGLAAAEHLTPVTLELGGKSPAIIDATADVDKAARRVLWGKSINAGQTCVAPDYLLVHQSIEKPFIAALKKHLTAFYGDSPIDSPHLARIIHRGHFDRLVQMIGEGRALLGGRSDAGRLRIEPTLLAEASPTSRVMTEEIFGPILPIVSWQSLDEAMRLVKERPQPLALYFFSDDKKRFAKVARELPFGGGCFNDTLLHLANPNLPFGGVGASGMGAYHGKFGFDTFSHKKALMARPYRGDNALRYPPYSKGGLSLLRRLLGP